ncbi:hypothetical protein M446_0796 [Methylobacterium sp. 4-46]|uniref:hypothetical protein n=1 Tax=unclassified Methylobacterium TaxID=2615210 RepID=UPI000165C878|nr:MULTISPECIES: hypothetical protein [Methylobacterium]ACA15350.1 hypothetical protein M446_0796 [Methylobacterium sp. 4-46]WFT81073.1 hypothetical protein QA634_03995 [Methylobacterium nodulans]
MASLHRRAVLRDVSCAVITAAGLALVPSAAEAVLLRAGPVGDANDDALVEKAQAVVVVPRRRRRRVCWWRRGRRVCAWR